MCRGHLGRCVCELKGSDRLILQEQERRWIPWALGAVLMAIVISHLVPWLNSEWTVRKINGQQKVLWQILQYERLVGQFDESVRGLMLAPGRPELVERKAEVVAQLRHQLEELVESGPSEGEFAPVLVSLADHLTKKLLPEATQVEILAKSPGDWALQRFRSEYAGVRLDHLKRVSQLLEQTRSMATEAFGYGQRRLVLSAGICCLVWSLVLTVMVAQGRFQGSHGPGIHTTAHTMHGPAITHAPSAHHTEPAAHENTHEHAHPTAAPVPVEAHVEHVSAEPVAVTPAASVSAATEAPAAVLTPATPPVETAPTPVASTPAPTPVAASVPTPVPTPVAPAPTLTPTPTPVAAAATVALGGGVSQDDISALLQTVQGGDAPAAVVEAPKPAEASAPTPTPPPAAPPVVEPVAKPTPAAPAPAAASSEPPRTIRASEIAPAPGGAPAGPIDLSF